MTWPARSRRRAELPRDWPAIRARIMRRDHGRCRWTEAGVRCTSSATDVDHIGNRHDHSDNNLRALCQTHHRQVTALQGVLARGHTPRGRYPQDPHPSTSSAS